MGYQAWIFAVLRGGRFRYRMYNRRVRDKES